MTDMKKGLVLGSTGLNYRRHDNVNREVVQNLAHAVVRELQPRYGYCTDTLGWNGAWGWALLETKVPYCMLLPYRMIGANWFHGDKANLDTYISNAEDVVYISEHYRPSVYEDTAKYLLAHVDGIVSLSRPYLGSRVIAMAGDLSIPVTELWERYNHTLLDNEEVAQ